MSALLSLANICKSYAMGEEEYEVLHDVNLTIERGELISIFGPSGSGKTTLMNIIGCLDVPTSGEYVLDGTLVADLEPRQLARIRNKKIGFVFQNFQLLPRLNTFSNVELPLIYSGLKAAERRQRVLGMLELVGLSHKAESFPNQLSGGQQQRVAIARSMVTEPSIILADEPTGALDQKTGQQIMDLFRQFNQAGRTIIMITHDPIVAAIAKRTVRILDGRLSEEGGAINAKRDTEDVCR
ncbi:MAG: antimicrobial peptide ABC transporter ATPase [Bacillota bacterium]|nr:MAG: antimicrobial peptide ABC transporter ATPase [Bacillota bacterium]MBS3950515.1 ABC transporter ATP-binding protein [Peptococcaceae bacterium]